MAWKKGTKLIFSEEGIRDFSEMKGKKGIFVERARLYKEGGTCLWTGLIYVKHSGVIELWNKDYWEKRETC